MRNALTFDVEEYFHAHAYEHVIDRTTWDDLPSRVVDNTTRILDLLDVHDTRATFFVLGWVAERHPTLVRTIAERGHEIASHGHAHQLVYRQSPGEFGKDLELALAALRAAIGDETAVLGYRAPSFSLTNDTPWAFEVLRAHGFLYDSSILPLADERETRTSSLRGGKRAGVSGVGRFASRLPGDLWEFPLSTVPIRGRNWTVAGGGMFRLLPLRVTEWLIDRINREGQPAIVYLHPWELDPDEPHVPEAPPLSRFRHRLNLDKTERRLRRLLERGDFGPMRDVFAPQLAAA